MQPNFNLTDTDLMPIIADYEKENKHLIMSQQITTSNETPTRQVVAKKSSPRIHVFNNCEISGNIMININKMQNKNFTESNLSASLKFKYMYNKIENSNRINFL